MPSSILKNGVHMTSMKNALIAALAVAPFAFGAAHASDPDEYTLQPIGVGSTSTSTIIYSPQTTTSGTVITQPTTGQDGQWTNVDINDYIIQDSGTNNQ